MEPGGRAPGLHLERVEILIVGGDTAFERLQLRLDASSHRESFRVTGRDNLGAGNRYRDGFCFRALVTSALGIEIT